MTPLRLALILSIALLCGCLAQRETLPGTNGITVAYASQSQIPGLNGEWDPKANTILLKYGAPDYVLSHEACHAADTLGSYQLAIRLIGNPAGLDRQMAIARKVGVRAEQVGHWRALYEACGEASVASHPEILAAVRVPSLAMKAKK